MWGKFAAIVGPVLMAGVTTLAFGYTDDHKLSARIGFLSLLILFALGAYVFSKVDVEEGEKIAKEYL